MFCPCGEEIKENQKFCTHCGAKLFNETKNVVEEPVTNQDYVEKEIQQPENAEKAEEPENTDIGNSESDENPDDAEEADSEEFDYLNKWMSITLKVIGVFVGIEALVYIIMSIFGKDIDADIYKKVENLPQEDAPGPVEKLREEEQNFGAKSCDDTVVKDLVLNVFKQKDYFYKYLNSGSIQRAVLDNISVANYDSGLDQYTCTADVIIQSNAGLKPKEYEGSNKFYQQVSTFHTTDDGIPTIKKVSQIKCPVTYTSQVSNGKDSVYSSYCGDGYDGNETAVFTWEDDYVEIPGYRQKMEKERKERERIIEQQRQEEERLRQQELKREQDKYNKSKERIPENVEKDLF